jgi:hypothetical protein
MTHGNHKAKVWDDEGQDTGATFAVEVVGGATTLRYDSRGTTAGTRAYRAGLVLLFKRLAQVGVQLRDACVETRTTKHLSRVQRRLRITGRSWPLDLAVEDPEQLRAAFGTAAARVGRPANAKGGGNGTKRLRLYLEGGAASWDVPALELELSGEPAEKGRRTA